MQEHDPLFDTEPSTEPAPVRRVRPEPDAQALAIAAEAAERAAKAQDVATRKLNAARIAYADAMAELARVQYPPCEGADGTEPTPLEVRDQAARIEAHVRARGEEHVNQRTHRPRAPMFGPRTRA